MKSRFSLVLWASYVLTMAASIGHLAWTFGTLEPPGFQRAGWLPALAVDAGLGALAYAIQQRRRAGRRALSLWGGVAVFTAVSGYANFKHAAAGGAAWWDALTLSAILPLLVVYLGEIISSDDAAAADAAARELARQERAQARLDAAQERQAVPSVPLVPSVTPAVSPVTPLSQAAQYAADNGVSIRTAYRHLARAGAPVSRPPNGVTHG